MRNTSRALGWGLLATALLLGIAPDVDARQRRRGRFGKLMVNSMTDGAKILIDGQQVGVVPLEKPLRLKVGKHTLKMTKRGYTEFMDVFRIRPRRTTSLDIDLLPFAGFLKVTANVKKARVFVDGKFVGTAPAETDVMIGERTVRVRKAGYYEYIGKFKSIAGQVKHLQVKLKPMPVGATPYRPPPPPPPRWYEKWYVWAGAAGAVAAVTAAIVVPVVLSQQDEVGDFCGGADFCWNSGAPAK